MNNSYSKLIGALVVNAVGLAVAFGAFDEGTGQQVTVAATAMANLFVVWLMKNR